MTNFYIYMHDVISEKKRECVCVCMYIYMSVCVCVCVCLYTHIHAYIHTYLKNIIMNITSLLLEVSYGVHNHQTVKILMIVYTTLNFKCS